MVRNNKSYQRSGHPQENMTIHKINISPGRQTLIVYAVLALATLAVFWQVREFDFVSMDDDMYVTQNSHVQSGMTSEGVRWAFSTKYSGLWYPLTWLSYMLDHHLHGMNAGAYHWTNVFLHILSTLMLFWLFHRMTGAVWKSGFVAALFALHPLHVESVAWISERKDVLSAFFWMLTLCLYVCYTEKPSVKRYLLIVVGFIFALMSKPMAVTLPLVMLLLDYWPLSRFPFQSASGKRAVILFQVREKGLFFVLATGLAVVTLYPSNGPPGEIFSLSSRLLNAPVAFMAHLAKTFWPRDPAAAFSFANQPQVWQVSVAVCIILLVSFAVVLMMKRLPYLFVGWFWYAITIAPVLGIIPINRFSPVTINDHYTYLPSVGIAVMLAWGIPSLIRRAAIRKRILLSAGVIMALLLAVLSWQQCGHWKNSFTMTHYILRVTPHDSMAHAIAYTYRARAYIALGQYQQAMEDYDQAVRTKPDCAALYNDRGFFYDQLGRYWPAIENYNEAIRLNPNHVLYYINRGAAYDNLGLYQNAIGDYNHAINLQPDYVEAYNNRGIAYRKLGQHQLALKDFNTFIRLKPENAIGYHNRAFLYLKQGNKNKGCLDAQKACELGICKLFDIAKTRGICP